MKKSVHEREVMTKNTLRLESVGKYFDHAGMRTCILNTISTTFNQGTTYAIKGVSGTGKSTLMHIIGGLDMPTSGVVWFNSVSLATMTALERAAFFNLNVGFIFQQPYLIKELSAIENVMVPGLIAGIDTHTCVKRAEELLEKVSLTDKKKSKVGALSGGQQQRIALARALFNKPAFLIADEPTGDLDEKTGRSMVELLLSCVVQENLGIILTTHDQYVAASMSTVYRLHEGHLEHNKG